MVQSPSFDCAIPWGDTRVRIVEPETCRPCPPGTEGELWVSGSGLGTGYWNRPEESAAQFAAETVPPNGARYLRSGDLGLLDGDRLLVTGRLKDLIILYGRKHHPEDIEATVLAGDPALRAAAAFAVPDSRGGEAVALLVETAPGAMNAPQREEALCRRVSAVHGLALRDIRFLRPGRIPRTNNGKVRRRECRALFVAGARGTAAAPRPVAVSA